MKHAWLGRVVMAAAGPFSLGLRVRRAWFGGDSTR
jgi:hypothetical protein